MVLETEAGEQRADAIASGLVGLGAVLVLFAILHHPVVGRGAGTPEGLAHSVRQLGAANAFMHGMLMLVLVGQTVGLGRFCRLLGLRRMSVSGGLTLWAFGSVMTLVATVCDGFVSPIAADVAAGQGLLLLWSLVQGFTRIGLLGQALAGALWGLALMLNVTEQPKARATGAVVTALGIAPAALMAFSAFRFDPHSLLLVLAFQSAWQLGIAIVLGRAATGAGGHSVSPA